MKTTKQKTTVGFLFALLAFGILASATANAAPRILVSEGASEKSRILVAYFSLAGNTANGTAVDVSTSASVMTDGTNRRGTTEHLARLICDSTAGDLYAINTQKLYPADFNAVVAQARRERTENLVPVLRELPVDILQYKTIFIGYPVWSSTIPQAVQVFLESYDFTGKTIIPFCTHDGYGAGNSVAAIRRLCPTSTVIDGFALEASRINSAANSINRWLQSLSGQLSSGNKDKHMTVTAVSIQKGETRISVTIGNTRLYGTLNDSNEAALFAAMLPVSVSMRRWDNREYYGSIPRAIPVKGSGKFTFENGEITYCPANNSVAIFFDKSVKPTLGMEVYSIGTITADMAVFKSMANTVSMVFDKTE